MEAFEPAGSEDVITQNDVAPEAGRLMQSGSPRRCCPGRGQSPCAVQGG